MRQGLPAHPSSVGRARQLLRSELLGTALEPLTETAELVVSEVVTNAIVHTGTAIELAALLDHTGLRVEVADSGKHLPVMASYDAMASTGRGLHLVAELTDRWGVEARAGGKVFWFHLGLSVRDEAAPGTDMAVSSAALAAADARGSIVDVVLLNLPALIHGAWQQHAKALLRDLLLIGIDEEATLEIAAHAAAIDAMAILEEQVGSPEVSEDPVELLASTVEPHATRARLNLVVPRASVPHFATLNRQLDWALACAQAGRLLTPPTQPEFQAFRRWVCEQVQRQAEGQPPQHWATPTPTTIQRAAPGVSWDGAVVTQSLLARIAADGAGLIIAASQAATELLKYASSDELAGMRLVDIIPTRYHQAHLAGFSLHQITGRGPLLNRAVVVPALCRDGTEVEVELLITTTRAAGGGSIFVADLKATSPL